MTSKKKTIESRPELFGGTSYFRLVMVFRLPPSQSQVINSVSHYTTFVLSRIWFVNRTNCVTLSAMIDKLFRQKSGFRRSKPIVD